MRGVRLSIVASAVPLLCIWGCASWSTPPPTSHPYFAVDPADIKSLHALARKQDALASKCAEHNTCEHVYYTRALLGLYESREAAEKYFDKVIAAAPKSQLASSSRLWLQLLKDPTPTDRSWFSSVMTAPAISDAYAALAQTSDRLVRDLLDRELMVQQLRVMKDADTQTFEALQRDLTERERRMEALTSKREPPKVGAETATVQALQKQLTERDKKIEELTSQLEALKRIDQEMRDKIRPIRPPSTVAPLPPTSEPAPAPPQ
jgi:molybdopterin converting factor small subunit